MPYSTPAMLRLALVPGGDGTVPSPVSRTAADLPDAQLVDEIAEADAQINSYIGKFYAVPVALVDGATPDPIRYWSRNIAAYNATLTYRKSQDLPDTDPVALRWRATMDALKAVSLGTVKLQLPGNVSPNAGVGVGTALNPGYRGDLFDAADFNLHPISPSWPLPGCGPYDGHWR